MSDQPSSIVMLPERFKKVLALATGREQEATLRMGALRTQYLVREAELLDLIKKATEEKRHCVREGLIALGLDPDQPGRHFEVRNDGGVLEMVSGNWVTPQGVALPEGKRE